MSIEADATGIILNTAVQATVKGGEMAIRIAGEGAKHLVALLVALKNNPNMKGAVNIKRMLADPRPNTVITLPEKNLGDFQKTAKEYGFPYAIIRDKSGRTGECDIMIREEDASAMNRALEKMEYLNFQTTRVEKTVTPGGKDRPLQRRPEPSRPEAENEFQIHQVERKKGTETVFSTSSISKETIGKNPNGHPYFAGSENSLERASLKEKIAALRNTPHIGGDPQKEYDKLFESAKSLLMAENKEMRAEDIEKAAHTVARNTASALGRQDIAAKSPVSISNDDGEKDGAIVKAIAALLRQFAGVTKSKAPER